MPHRPAWCSGVLELHPSASRSCNSPQTVTGGRFQPTPFVPSFSKEFVFYFTFWKAYKKIMFVFPPRFTALCCRRFICAVTSSLNFFPCWGSVTGKLFACHRCKREGGCCVIPQPAPDAGAVPLCSSEGSNKGTLSGEVSSWRRRGGTSFPSCS